MESSDQIPESPAPVHKSHSPNDPPWNALVAFLFWIVSVFLVAALPLVFLVPYLQSKGVSVAGNKQFQKLVLGDPTAVLVALGGTFAAHLVTIALAWLIVTRANRFSFRKMLGWKLGGFKIWHALLLFAGVYVFNVVLTTLLGSHENEMTRILSSSRAAVFSVAFIATFSAPIVEEVVYRGILYSAFQRTFNVPIAVFAVTSVFALIHVAQYYPDWSIIISILPLSLILTMIRVKTDNLLPCIIFHSFFNGVQSVLLILQPYLPEALDPSKVEGLLF